VKTFSDDDEVQDTVMTWLREQAGDFYDAGIKKLVPRLTNAHTEPISCPEPLSYNQKKVCMLL
jgi:hypothetical protein